MRTNNPSSLNIIEISAKRIQDNMRHLVRVNNMIAIAPVLKSNAYGHGSDLVGQILEEFNVPFYCVNSLREAIELTEAGITTDILIMGYVDPEELRKQEWKYIFSVFDIDYASTISKFQKNPRVHIAVETGLHREGIDILASRFLLEKLVSFTNLKIEGMMSHLACSNDPSCEITSAQLANFEKAKAMVVASGLKPKWFHLGGSLALLNNLADACNVVRVGKAVFGIALNTSYSGGVKSSINTNVSEYNPVLSLKTKIAQIKVIKKGDHVGYADAFIADKDMVIGILPIGYNDGVDRRLIKKGFMHVAGRDCAILGIIAMNVTTIDVTEIVDPFIGQEVIVYSQDKASGNSLDKSAAICGTLPQDLLLHLPTHVPRLLIDS